MRDACVEFWRGYNADTVNVLGIPSLMAGLPLALCSILAEWLLAVIICLPVPPRQIEHAVGRQRNVTYTAVCRR